MGNQATVSAGNGTATPAPNPIMSFVPMIVVIGILYFLIIRPQQKQVKELKQQVDALKAGDRVLTQGGIYGTVVALRGPIVQVKISEQVKVDVSRAHIAEIVREQPADPADTLGAGV